MALPTLAPVPIENSYRLGPWASTALQGKACVPRNTHPQRDLLTAWMALSSLVMIARLLLALLTLPLRSRVSMQLEILALRHQLTVYQRSGVRARLKPGDRIFWAWLSRVWSGWRNALVFVQPATVIAWQRKRFREHWTRFCRRRKPGRPAVALEVRALIRRMSRANPTWGGSASSSPSRQSTSTCSAAVGRPPPPGGRSSVTTRGIWSPATSSWSRRSASRCYSYWWCWLNTGGEWCTSA